MSRSAFVPAPLALSRWLLVVAAMVLLMVFRPGGLWGFQEQSKGQA